MIEQLVLVWIPSHIGLKGNEIADRLAGSAIANAQVDVHIPLEMGEAYLLVEQYVVEQWQRGHGLLVAMVGSIDKSNPM